MPVSSEMVTTQEAFNVHGEDQQELGEDTEMVCITIFSPSFSSQQTNMQQEIHRIIFKIWENNRLVDQRISTEMYRPQIEQYVRNQVKAGMCLLNTNGRALNETNCYDAVVRDGTKTIIFVPRDNIDITHPLIISAGQSSAISGSSKRRQVMREEESEEEL